MTRSSVTDLEDDLRTLFASQAEAVDVAVTTTVAAPCWSLLPTNADAPSGRRRTITIAAASVAAMFAIVITLTTLGRDAEPTDVRAGEQSTLSVSTPEPIDPEPTDPEMTVPTSAVPAAPAVDPIDSVDEFRRRVEDVYRAPGARALFGDVVIGEASDVRTSPDEPRGYGVNVVAANGARGGIATGDQLLPLGRPETAPGETVIEPVALPAGIEEGVMRDSGRTVAVTLRGHDQFVTLVIEKVDTGVTPSMLIPIAAAVLVPPLPAPTTGPGVSDLGRFDATVLPDGFFETGVAETADPTSTSVTAHFLTGTDQQALMTGRRLNVTTVRNADAAAVMADIGGQPGIRTLDVRGYPALIQVPFSPSLEPTTALSLVWSESPTMVVFVNGRGLTEVELVAVANGLRPR